MTKSRWYAIKINQSLISIYSKQFFDWFAGLWFHSPQIVSQYCFLVIIHLI